jgi:hypothetical protein
MTSLQNCGSWIWTWEEILPNVAFASVTPLNPGTVAGVA